MNRRALTNPAAGLAAGILLLGTAACTGGTEGRDEKDHRAAACTHGTYVWSGVVREQKLTGLADPITLKRKTDSVSGVIKPLKGVSYKPHMTSTGPGARAAEAIKALGRHLGTDQPLAGPSEPAEPEVTPSEFSYDLGDLKGSYYAWNSVALVEADFTYTCRGGAAEPVRGHVVTWETVGGGFLSCAERMIDEGPAKAGAAERTAARTLCPAGSPAAKSA
ncbi:hypothetical protein OG780_15565 [Streptomyces sp. NBC_00386]|jgi:hypothetical protein|uniref:hypothetical protein n=1 Tax=Streptomyces sp. NBC_00386 TaxID=2975734 RepID=UPI002E247A51